MPTTQRASLFSALNALATEINGEKQAAAAQRPAANGQANGQTKQAGPTPPDPGGYQGKSDHPTANIDNHVQGATEGARSSENESDIKDDQGQPSVNNAPDASNEGRQDEVQLNIGTHASATGEDASTEDNYKGTKDDHAEGGMGGTTHPASTEDGEKYGSFTFKQARAKSATLGNEILAALATGLGDRLTAKTAGSTQPAAGQTAAAGTTKSAAQAGYELAAALGITKEAAAVNVQDCLLQTIQDAETDADLLAGFLKKQAAGEEEGAQEGEDHSSSGDETSGAGASESAGGGGPPADPAAGGGAPGGGGPDLGALLGGGGGGAAPGGMGGGMGGGEPSLEQQQPSQDEALQELAMALEELGIPLDQLAALGSGGAGGAGAAAAGGMGGGMPGGDAMGGAGGAMPAEAAGPPSLGGAPPAKVASAVREFKRSGKFQYKEAHTKRSRQLRDLMKGQLRELFPR